MGKDRSIKDERIDLVLAMIRPVDKVLHAGCVNHETGDVSRENWLHGRLQAKCQNVLGIDIEEKEIKKMRGMGFKVRVADCEHLALGEKFDVIVAGELLEHLANPGRFLDRAKEHLLPGGKLILSTPNVFCYWHAISVLLRGRPTIHPEHVAWYDETTLRHLVERHGFKSLDVKYVPIPSTGRGRLLSLVLVRLGLARIGGAGILMVCGYNEKQGNINAKT
ncbi:MAG: class I SAM-dependent methyltransferase [Candidatus Omnitrophica bacterium]|nr:class I SAM-dependent methyltransferase [Candidatus Omnitrophota bacterium]